MLLGIFAGFLLALINHWIGERIVQIKLKTGEGPILPVVLLCLQVLRAGVVLLVIILTVRKAVFPVYPFILSFFLSYFVLLVYHIARLKEPKTS